MSLSVAALLFNWTLLLTHFLRRETGIFADPQPSVRLGLLGLPLYRSATLLGLKVEPAFLAKESHHSSVSEHATIQFSPS